MDLAAPTVAAADVLAAPDQKVEDRKANARDVRQLNSNCLASGGCQSPD